MSKVEKVDLFSHKLGKEMNLLVYLPQSNADSTPLPVLYFLHGRSGDENMMLEMGINAKADKMIREGEIKPMIIVCPRIENSRGINSSYIHKAVPDPVNAERLIHVGMYEDYLMEEIVPFTDKTYHTVKDRAGRYIGGVSGGGYAALHLAFRHQHLFSKVGGHMPAIELHLEAEDMPYFRDLDVWEKYDPISIAKKHDIAPDMQVYLDAGHEDEGRFFEGCSILHGVLKGKGIHSRNHVFSGNHSAAYVASNLEKYLKFYGE